MKPGDILVGKVTPKGETQLTPEEKLLRAIFGEKASDVKDTSLRVPSGMDGTVIDVQVFTRDGVEKDARALQIEDEQLAAIRKDLNDQLRIMEDDIYQRVEKLLLGKVAEGGPKKLKRRHQDHQATTSTMSTATSGSRSACATRRPMPSLEKAAEQLKALRKDFDQRLRRRKRKTHHRRRSRAGRAEDGQGLSGREAPRAAGRQDGRTPRQQGRDLDDPAGRGHAVSSPTAPPVDIVLNPLGVPSRMNVGQVLETHLGWAAKGLGIKIGKMLDAQQKVAEIRAFLDQIYNSSGRRERSELAERRGDR